MRQHIMATAAALLVASGAAEAVPTHLSNAQIQSVQQGKVSQNGTTCLYIQVFIPAELAAPLNYTLLINKTGHLVSALIIESNHQINFDYDTAVTNSDCNDFPGFSTAPAMSYPSHGTVTP